tara:strand:- start:22417 stop:23937 length:1521 start_codon:yes stop_codon:yes gene_type:complete
MQHELILDKKNEHGLTLAAIDLGSNSFHMLIARANHHEMRPIVGFAERVQLALDIKHNQLTSEAMSRGLLCLSRFKQALDALKPDMVRIVGTNALRVAKNADIFVSSVEDIIGCPVEVVSGREEARLIYLGVAHTLANDDTRLVVDIGGGSTELIIGRRFESQMRESLHMGCVTFSNRFSSDGLISPASFATAYNAACKEVINIQKSYKKHGWSDVVGSSGTIRSIEKIVYEQGWSSSGISIDALHKLRNMILKSSHVDELPKMAHLSEDRRPLIVSGLAILCGIFDSLDIKHMSTSAGALREGIVYDLLGRLAHEDVREHSISAMMLRSEVDQQNAEQAKEIAMLLFDSCSGDWDLGSADRKLLGWAAHLHEIGLSVAHTQYHKHGQYLIEHSDLQGFNKFEQKLLGLLVRGHRQKFPLRELRRFSSAHSLRLKRLIVMLRLAVLFKYIISDEGDPPFMPLAKTQGITLRLTQGWLAENSLMTTVLEIEQQYLIDADFVLTLVEV